MGQVIIYSNDSDASSHTHTPHTPAIESPSPLSGPSILPQIRRAGITRIFYESRENIGNVSIQLYQNSTLFVGGEKRT